MGNCGADLEDKGWIKAWDITTKELIFETDMHGACMESLSASPDGHWLAAITGYGRLRVLSASTGEIVVDQLTIDLNSLVWWGYDRMLLVHYPSNPYGWMNLQSIGMLDMQTMQMTPILLPGFENIYSLAWLPEGERLVTNSAGDTLSIWEAAAGQRLEQFQISLGGVSLTNFSPASISPVDGTLAIPAQGSVATINLETGQVIQVMEYEVTWPETHAAMTSWSGDGKKLAGQVYDQGYTNIVVWEAATGKAILATPFEMPFDILDLALSPDGTKLALSEWNHGEYQLSILNIEAKKEIISIKTPCPSSEIIWINQNQVSVTSLGWIEIYDITTGNKVRMLAEGHTYAVSPDRSLVAADNLREGITISDFSSGKKLAELKLEPVFLDNLAFSPDGKLLAALTEFGSVIVWDMSGYYK
jgi:WD40 repeat protein